MNFEFTLFTIAVATVLNGRCPQTPQHSWQLGQLEFGMLLQRALVNNAQLRTMPAAVSICQYVINSCALESLMG